MCLYRHTLFYEGFLSKGVAVLSSDLGTLERKREPKPCRFVVYKHLYYRQNICKKKKFFGPKQPCTKHHVVPIFVTKQIGDFVLKLKQILSFFTSSSLFSSTAVLYHNTKWLAPLSCASFFIIICINFLLFVNLYCTTIQSGWP